MIEDFFFFWSEVDVWEVLGVSSAFEEAEEWPEAAEVIFLRVRVGCVAWAIEETLEAAFLGSTYLTLMRILFRREAGEGRVINGSVGMSTR